MVYSMHVLNNKCFGIMYLTTWYEVNLSECTCTKYLEYDSNTVEPPNKGHFGCNINSDVVSFVERLSSLRRFKKYWKQMFGTLTCVLCREVYYIVPLSIGGTTVFWSHD